ncbi:MAG: hypothetical protein L0Y54_01465 [Sporichthyaceae bacterium]|nr:hypothetical protein [Sporichthyaceae bacterium]
MADRRVRRGVLVGAVAAASFALLSPAVAVVGLAPRTPVVAGAADSYSFATTLPSYWTAVAVRPQAGVDYDLTLVDPATGGVLASSVWGGAATDVIAINSGYRPPGNYLANVTKYSGTGVYSVMFWELREVMGVPTSPTGGISTAIGLNFANPVRTMQVYMQAGQGFRVNHNTDTRVYLAGSTPGVPSTYVRNRSALENLHVIADNVPSPTGSVCRVFQVPATGWYSLILIWNTPWTPPPYNGGFAAFPQRYNPALGDTLTQCPAPGP